jgi:hypothetical protein
MGTWRCYGELEHAVGSRSPIAWDEIEPARSTGSCSRTVMRPGGGGPKREPARAGEGAEFWRLELPVDAI